MSENEVPDIFELTEKLERAERQVGELREQLEDSVSMLTRQGAKLDTAMGLLRKYHGDPDVCAYHSDDIGAFLNTTSTEANAAEILCKRCAGYGSVSTGIDECPTTICDPCNGTGKTSTEGKDHE